MIWRSCTSPARSPRFCTVINNRGDAPPTHGSWHHIQANGGFQVCAVDRCGFAVSPIIVASYSAPLLADAQLAALSAPVVQILQQINQHRASLKGAALLPLEWDAPLAAFATQAPWPLAGCSTAAMPAATHPGWPGQYSGENLAAWLTVAAGLACCRRRQKLIHYFQRAI